MVLSHEADSNISPFFEKCKFLIAPEWPVKTLHFAWTELSQSLICLSSPPDAMILESGEKTTSYTGPLCPINL